MTRDIIVTSKVDENVNNYLNEESKKKGITRSQLIFEILSERVISIQSGLSETEKFGLIKTEMLKELEQKISENLRTNNEAIYEVMKNDYIVY